MPDLAPKQVHPEDLLASITVDGKSVPHLLGEAGLAELKAIASKPENWGKKFSRQGGGGREYSIIVDTTGEAYVIYQGKSDAEKDASMQSRERQGGRFSPMLRGHQEFSKEERLLGAGASGRVKVVQNTQGKWFAMKVMTIQKGDEEAKRRVQLEIAACKKVGAYIGELTIKKEAELDKAGQVIPAWLKDEEEIASLKESEVKGNDEASKYYLIMPLFPGVTLEKAIATGALNSKMKGIVFANILKGVEALHKAGFLHRDLKPGNIIVDPETGDVNLIDMGLADKIDPALLTPGCIDASELGTAKYMPPESFQASYPELDEGLNHTKVLYSKAGDVFALGRIAIEMVLGSRAQEIVDDPHTVWNNNRAADMQEGIAYTAGLLAPNEGMKNASPSQEVLIGGTGAPKFNEKFFAGMVNKNLQIKFEALKKKTEEVALLAPEETALFEGGLNMLNPSPADRPSIMDLIKSDLGLKTSELVEFSKDRRGQRKIAR